MSLLNEVYCLLTHTFLVIVLYCLCQGELVLHGLLYIVTLIQAQLCVQILSCLFSSLPSFGAHGMCHCFHNFHPLFTHCVFPNYWCFPHSLFSIPSVCLSFSIFFFSLVYLNISLVYKSDGFNRVFPMDKLQTFTPEELQLLVCGEQSPSWTHSDLLNYTEPKFGYTKER